MRDPTGAGAASPGGWQTKLVRLWPAICGIVAGGAIYLQTRAAGLWNDDVYNLQEHLTAGLDELITRPVALRQFAPGHRLLTELQLLVGPTDRVVMHGVLAVSIGLSVALAAHVATRLHRRTWWLPVAITVAAVGPAGFRATAWYAGAYHIVPSLLLGLAGVAAFMRWRRKDGEGSNLPRGVPITAAILTLLGTAFSIKALLAPLLLFLVEYLIERPGDLRTTVARVRSELRVWVPFLAIGVAHLVALQWSGVPPSVGHPATIVEAVVRGIATTSVPLLVGLAPSSSGALEPFAIGVAWAVVGGGAILMLRSRRLRGRAVVAAATVIVASVALPSLITVSSFGASAGTALRYHLEGIVYAWLAIAAGIRPPRAQSAPSLGRLGHAGLALTVVTALVVGTVWSNRSQWEGLGSVRSGVWIASLEHDLAHGTPATPVLDTPLPPYVIDIVPGRRILDLDGLVPGLIVDAGAGRVVTDEGRVESLDAAVLSQQDGAAFARNGLVDIRGDHRLRAAALCTDAEATIELLVGPHPEPRLLEVALSGAAAVRVDYTALPGRPKDPPLQTTASDTVVRLPLDVLGWTERIHLGLAAAVPDEDVCIERVSILEVRNDLPQYGDLAD